MPFKINHYPSRQKPDLIRTVYLPLTYYEPAKYKNNSRYSYIKTLRTKRDVHPNKFILQTQERTGSKPYHETIYRRGVRESEGDKFYIVTALTENRLDIISQIYYNTPTLWWVIAQANGSIVFNPFNVPRGLTLRIPPISTLYSNGGYLSAN